MDGKEQWGEREIRLPFECGETEEAAFLAHLEQMARIYALHTRRTKDEAKVAVMRTLGWLA